MAVIKINTSHVETSEAFVPVDVAELSLYATDEELNAAISGVSGGTAGTSGTSGTSGIDGSAGSLALIETNVELTLTGTSVYVRASGSTYAINLPAATGSLEQVWIKNVGDGNKTVTADGTDLIDGAATKVIPTSGSAIFMDVAAGFWDIN